MGKLIAAVAVLCLAMVSGPALAVQPSPGVFTYSDFLSFSSDGDSFSYQVDAAQGAGTLTVATQDCCISGDIWVTFLEHGQKSGSDTATGTGSGSTSQLSGSASHNGWSKGTVTITYESGVDIFPAGVAVEFTYSPQGSGAAKGNTGMVVTPL